MKKVVGLWLIAVGAAMGITSASADEPTPTPSATTTSVVITYDSEADLWVTPIDEHTIEVSRPD